MYNGKYKDFALENIRAREEYPDTTGYGLAAITYALLHLAETVKAAATVHRDPEA